MKISESCEFTGFSIHQNRKVKALGNFSKAVSEAESLHLRQDSAESLLLLIEAQLQKGDVTGLTYNAQKILHLPDVEPKYILRVAKIAALEDAELAKKLWRRVKNNILDEPELVRDALDIGFALGLDNETRDLMSRMQIYARERNTPFKTFSFKETLQQMKKASERQNQLYDSYAKGKMPLHFLAGGNRLTLATLLHDLPENSRAEVDLRRAAKIFTRFGGRSMREGYFEVKPHARLYMDITSFLLATELGILDQVEKTFAPIHVPAALPLALTAERQKLRSHQIAQILIHRRIIEALEKNAFELFSENRELDDDAAKTFKETVEKLGAGKVAFIVAANNEGAIVVKHLPISDREAKPFVLPDALAGVVVNCRVVAENLFHFGHLDQIEFDATLEKLGTDARKILGEPIIVPPNTKFYLDDYMVNALEKASLLDKTCEHYRVFADKDYIERIKAEIAAYERDEKTANWVQAAEKRLSEGFTAGTYVGISVEERQTFENADMPNNVDVEVVTELLQLARQDDAYIWIDDRSVNSHSNAAGVLIVTVTDILDALHRNGELTDDEYFERLLRLRAGNFRYIPVTSEEILRHLRAAKIIEGKIVETNALSILRRYSAACLLDEQCLQKPPMPKGAPNIFGELNFALEMTGAVSDALVAVWNDDEDLRDAEIRADWIFDNLFVGKYGVRNLLPSSGAESDGSHEIGVDFSELLVKAIAMHGGAPDADGRTRRQLYFDWLNRRFLLPRLKADPNVVASAAQTLDSIFSEQTRREFEISEHAITSRRINAELFIDLPQRIASELKTDEPLLDWLGVSIDKYFAFGKNKFLSTEFWTAAEKAINGEPAIVSPAGSLKSFLVRRSNRDDDDLSIEIVDESTNTIETMEYPALGVLFRNRAKRIACLKNNRHWFDCEKTILEKEAEAIVSLTDLRGRIERISSQMRNSVAAYYKRIQAKFEFLWNQGKGASINQDDLEGFPPSGLLRHYRLNPKYESNFEFSAVIEDSAKKLLDEEGVTETIERLSHLPLKMPECVVNELKNLSNEERIKLFDSLIETLKSPLCKMQLVDLILRSAPGDEKLLGLAKILVNELFDDEQGNSDFNLFTAILRFVGEEFGYQRETGDWSMAVKLAMIWAHAGKLFNLLQPAFGNEAGFRQWFWNLHRHSSTIFGEKTEYLHDCLNPRKINRAVFQTHAAAALWTLNERQDLESLDVFEQIKKAVIFKDEIPRLELFRANELQSNSTNSIFGGDRAKIFSAFFGEGNWGAFSDTSIKKNAEQAIETLQKNPADDYGWTSLIISVGDSPIYADLHDKFITLASNLDFPALLEENMEVALKALSTTVVQVSIFDDELKQKCENWLFLLSKKIAGSNPEPKRQVITEEMIHYGYRLLETAFTLSFRTQNARASSRKFKDLMLGLLDNWSDFGAIAETAIATMNATLPLAQTQDLPEILLNIRASKPQNLMFKTVAAQPDAEEEEDV